MQILILETTNKDGVILCLHKEVDEEKYTILTGKYSGPQGRWTVKETCEDLSKAVSVYCELIKGLTEEPLNAERSLDNNEG